MLFFPFKFLQKDNKSQQPFIILLWQTLYIYMPDRVVIQYSGVAHRILWPLFNKSLMQ